jgi:hypothetical protein
VDDQSAGAQFVEPDLNIAPGLSAAELYVFRSAGFFTRAAILRPVENRRLRSQIRDNVLADRPHDVAVPIPAGAASLVLDHPKILDVVAQLVSPSPRIEYVRPLLFEAGRPMGTLVDFQPSVSDEPLLRFRVDAPLPALRVIVETTTIRASDHAELVCTGSHHVVTPPPAELLAEPDGLPIVSYACPAGSAVFMAPGLWVSHGPWRSRRRRLALEIVYSHPSIAYSRNTIPARALSLLAPERRALFRDPWQYDFAFDPPRKNALDRLHVVAAPDVPEDE